MARKSTALLKSVPVKLPKRSQQMLDKMEKFVPPEKTEEKYKRWIDASRALEEQWVKVDQLFKIVEKKGEYDPYWPEYQDALTVLSQRQNGNFGAYDAWRYAVKHKDDKIGAPEDDVRAITNDSLTGNLDELQFSLNHGLLASKVAQAIRALTAEESVGDPPLCQECGSEVV